MAPRCSSRLRRAPSEARTADEQIACCYPEPQMSRLHATSLTISPRRSHRLSPAPIAQLYNYLGAELALYFAFLRTFSLWLWAPAIAGLILFVFQETE